MKSRTYRRQQFVIAVAVFLYLLVMAVTWQFGTAKAELRTERMLKAAETGYRDVIHGEIEAALRNAGGAIINLFNGKCEPQTVERMQELAETFNVDEINIVNRNGIVIGSNVPSVLGVDFNDHMFTREFMALTNANTTQVSQPFRYGTANPDMYCKYYGLAFPGRVGLIQIGMSVESLRKNMYSYTLEESAAILRDWHFSVVGWYEHAYDDPNFKAGKMFRRWHETENMTVVGRYFTFGGYRYAALLPESYCTSQRNSMFLITSLVLAVLLALFTYFVVRLLNASEKLEVLHAAADARNAADLSLARTIQMSSLPSADGAFADWLEFALKVTSVPAREVGGDFYDFYRVAGDKIAFLVADVSGKGISAAMFMMEAKNVIKNCIVEHDDIAEAVQAVNRRLCVGNEAEMFVTAWIGVLDPKTGVVEYVNAGHNRPFLRRSDGTVEKVMGKGGRLLGMFDDAKYRSHTFAMGKGDCLVLYTDGVTEAMNLKGEMFGEGRLRDAIASAMDVDLDQILNDFVGTAEQSDDRTRMTIGWFGSPYFYERKFVCNVDSLVQVVDFVRDSLDGVGKKAMAAILNTTDEITSNVVNYSCADEFSVSVERALDRVRIRICDAGNPYNPLSHIDPDTHAAIEERPIGGLGLVMAKRLADRMSYVRENGCNVLTMIKRI